MLRAEPSWIDRLSGALRSGASWLTELIGAATRFALELVAPVVLAAGCQSAMDTTTVQQIAVPEPKLIMPDLDAAPPGPTKEDAEPKQLGSFSITFYYVIGEEEVVAKPAVAANDNQGSGSGSGVTLASVAPKSTLYSGTCEPIAEVSREFAMQLAIQGTGKLHDGRVLNIWGRCNCKESPCFKVTSAAWGTAGTGHPLQPFRTVAVDPKVVKLGSLLYVPLLEGRVMPGREPWGGFVHDGCVVADDVGGGIKGDQIDLFVGRHGWFLGMSGREGQHAWARHVPVYDGSKICERKGRNVGRKAGGV